jgi:hypothetical protein
MELRDCRVYPPHHAWATEAQRDDELPVDTQEEAQHLEGGEAQPACF